MSQAPRRWLRTDERLQAVLSLEDSAVFGTAVNRDLYSWRWVILALHNSVQGFMAVSLRFGDGLLALRDDIARKWLKAHGKGQRYPRERLDSFLGLYGKIQDRTKMHYVHSRPFVPQGTEDASIRRLNSLRNEFVHFLPRDWTLEVSGLPHICLDCLRVIEFVAWHSGNISWHDDQLKNRSHQALVKSHNTFGALAAEYEAPDLSE